MNVLTDIAYTRKIYTHSNTFHADEIMAIALLQQYVFKNDRLEIIRTGDKAVLEKARSEPGTFVLDVGTVYDPENLNFDHHQANMQEGWPDGIYYSSCGLIWKWLKDNKVLNQFMNDETVKMMEDIFIKPIDAHDNGQGVWPDAITLSKFNRNDDSPDGVKQYRQFMKALSFAKEILQNEFAGVRSVLKAEKTAARYIKNNYDPETKILVVEDNTADYLPFALKETNNELNLIIIPHSRNKWTIRTAPEVNENSFSRKNPSPTDWRGRTDLDVMVHGKKMKVVFSHKTGFMTIIEGSLEDAKSAGAYIVEWNKLQKEANVSQKSGYEQENSKRSSSVKKLSR